MAADFQLQDVKVMNDEKEVKKFVESFLEDNDESFYISDVGEMIVAYNHWVNHLPQIVPFYAIKCNDDPNMIKSLAALGCNFDCASKGEIKTVLDQGISPKRIIFANPTKCISHLTFAAERGVDLMTYDTEEEIYKIKELHPKAHLLVRIRADAEKATVQMGDKFGCAPTNAMNLIVKAVELGLSVKGISFHVGTGCGEPDAFPRAIRLSADIIREAKKRGIHLKVMDIGGGFPGVVGDTFKEMVRSLKEGLAAEGDTLDGVKVIAEPGRYFCFNGYKLFSNICGVRCRDDANWYYINNGIVGCFNAVVTEDAVFVPYPWKPRSDKLKRSLVWGPSENPKDLLVKDAMLPPMENGDWLVFDGMGAYTQCLDPMNWLSVPKPPTYSMIMKKDLDVIKAAAAKPKTHLEWPSMF